ncbi:MAG TPA: hypothetical protein VK709_09960 [Candidatus Saccharimonadales bacterium]|nr:hypothetical protein [Candidatus Saccharimonadales bacterium]
MRIDHTHKGWLIASLSILGVSLLVYGFYRVPVGAGSMGGTGAGLAFGSIGFAFMIFAALLGARKRVPVYRFGRAQTWMRGHLWLGLLSLPLILFHSGFRYGHGLTAWLMTILIIVVLSGLFGAALQHYMPRVMTREVTMETIYEEIGHVRAQLLEEAEELMKQANGQNKKTLAEGAEADPTSVAVAVAVTDEAGPLRNFYEQELKPYLEKPGARGSALSDATQSHSAFTQLRTLVPTSLQLTIDDLEGICEEERQLTLQSQLHVWLHGWLLLHIPLSLALILLGAIHAVMALRY